ncbi:MAG: hypothetical protein WCO84_07530, partial [bacterium]
NGHTQPYGSFAIVNPGGLYDDFIIFPNGTNTYTLYDPHTQTIIKEPSIPNIYAFNSSRYVLDPTLIPFAMHVDGLKVYALNGGDCLRVLDLETDILTVVPTGSQKDYDNSDFGLVNYCQNLKIKDSNTFSTATLKTFAADALGNLALVFITYDLSLTLTTPNISVANFQAITAVSATEIYCATVGSIVRPPSNLTIYPDYGNGNAEPELIIYKWNGTSWTIVHTISDVAYTWFASTVVGGEMYNAHVMPYTPLLMSHRYVGADLELVMLRDTPDSVFVYNIGTNTLTTAALQVQDGADNLYRSSISPSIPYVFNNLLSSSVSQAYRSGNSGVRDEIDVYAEARMGYNLSKDLYWVNRNKQPVFTLKNYSGMGDVFIGKSNTYYLHLPVNTNIPVEMVAVAQTPPSGFTIIIDAVSNTGIDFRLAVDNTVIDGWYSIGFNVSPFSQPANALNVITSLGAQVCSSTGPNAIPLNTVSSFRVFNSNIYAFGWFNGACCSTDGITWVVAPQTDSNLAIPGGTSAALQSVTDICENSPIGLLAAVAWSGIQVAGQYPKSVSYSITDISNVISAVDPAVLTYQSRRIVKLQYDGHRYISVSQDPNYGYTLISTSTDLMTWSTPEYTTAGGQGNTELKYSNGITMASLGTAGDFKRIIASTGEIQTINTTLTVYNTPNFASDGAGNWLYSAGGDATGIGVSTDNGLTWSIVSQATLGITGLYNMSVICKSGFFFGFFYDSNAGTMLVKRSTSPLFDANLQT